MPISDTGWGVKYTPSVENTKENNTMCTESNNKPIVSLSYFFSRTQVNKDIRLDLMNISHVKNMKGMFSHTNATPSNFNNFNTSNVENMSGMFQDNTSSSLDLSDFDTSKVTDMINLFINSQAETIDLSNFNTGNITNMSNIFRNSQAKSLDLSSFDTSKVTNMDSMFDGSKAKIRYARTQEDADKFNSSDTRRPSILTFVVKG